MVLARLMDAEAPALPLDQHWLAGIMYQPLPMAWQVRH